MSAGPNACSGARPHVTVKLATSLDGRIATHSGESRWITGPEARAAVHRLRAACDAVLIGSETAMADDPELTVRTDPAPARQPLRIVLDSRLRLSPTSTLVRTIPQAPLLIVAARDADPGAWRALEDAGARVMSSPRDLDGLQIAPMLERLAREQGVMRLLVEGGGRVAASFLRAGAADRLEWFRAPIVLGEEGRSGVGPLAVQSLADAPRFRRVALQEVGADLWESLERSV